MYINLIIAKKKKIVYCCFNSIKDLKKKKRAGGPEALARSWPLANSRGHLLPDCARKSAGQDLRAQPSLIPQGLVGEALTDSGLAGVSTREKGLALPLGNCLDQK